jgi:FtsH-binding integral membrane protein
MPATDAPTGNREDQRHSRRTAGWFALVLFLAATGLAAGSLLLDRRTYGVPLAAMLIVAAFLLVAAVAVPLIVVALQRARQQRLAWLTAESADLTRIAGTIKDRTLGDLISFNFRLMERFVGVAITQAQASYLACSAAATAGLLVLLVGAAVAMSVHDLASQITAGVLTTIGVAVSSYLSVTFLNTFKMTSKQMSYYYGQPLVHCYLLHAEWLGRRFEHGADPAVQWQIRQELIRAALDASRNAQDHLLDLQFESLKVATANGTPVPADGRARLS